MTLSDNIHRLIRPHLTSKPGGGYTTQPAYLDQLAEAVKPGMTAAGASKGGTPLPIRAEAIDLWRELDQQARDTEMRRSGTTRGTLGAIIEKWATETSHEWQDALEDLAADMISQIIDLLDPPPRRRPLNAPCYDCGQEWVYTPDGDRKPAVTIGTHHDTGELRDLPEMDMTCTACEHTWTGNEMSWPLKIINENRKEPQKA